MEHEPIPPLSSVHPVARDRENIPIDDVIAALLALIVQEARDTSAVPEDDPLKRLIHVLLYPHVQAILGQHWRVLSATTDAAIFVNEASRSVYLAVCGAEDWSNIEASRSEILVRRYAKKIENNFGELLHSLCVDGYSILLTGHGIGGNVALLLSSSIYRVRTFGSIETEADMNPDQSLTRHYRLEGDLISRRSNTRNNIKTLPFHGTVSDAHKMSEILNVILGYRFELDNRMANDPFNEGTLLPPDNQTQRLNRVRPLERTSEFKVLTNLDNDRRLDRANKSTIPKDSYRAYIYGSGMTNSPKTMTEYVPNMTVEKQHINHDDLAASHLLPDQVKTEITNQYTTRHDAKNFLKNKTSHHHVEAQTTQTTSTKNSGLQGSYTVTDLTTTETKTNSLKIDGNLHRNDLKETTTTNTSIRSRSDGQPIESREAVSTNAAGEVTREILDVMHERAQTKVTTDAQNQEIARTQTMTQAGNKTTHSFHTKKTYENGTLKETQSTTLKQTTFDTNEATPVAGTFGTTSNSLGHEKRATETTTGESQGHLAKTTRIVTEMERELTRENIAKQENIEYDSINIVTTTSGPKDGLLGNFINETKETRPGPNGVEPVLLNSRLNAGAERGLGIIIINSLETAMDCYSRWQKGEKIEKKYLVDQFVKLLTSVGEGYFAAQAGEIIAATHHLDKALPQAAWAMTIAYLARKGYNVLTLSSEERKEKWQSLTTSECLASTIEVTGSIARTGLQLALVGMKYGYSGPTMFGIDLVTNTVTQLASTLVRHGRSSKAILECSKIIVKSTVTAGTGMVASIGTTKALVYLLGASTTVGMSALTAGLGAAAFVAATTLCNKYLWGSSPAEDVNTAKEEQDYSELLQKYNLAENVTLQQIKKTYRMMSLAKHPDRGGSNAAFKEINEDFEALSTLFLVRESQRLEKGKDSIKLSFLQRAIDSLQSVIRRLLSKPTNEKQLNKLLELLKDDPNVSTNVNPEVRQLVNEAAEIARREQVDSFFAKLKYEDLKQYAESFAREGYDSEEHLLDIVDDEVELANLFDRCGVNLQGHRDRFKLALRELKKKVRGLGQCSVTNEQKSETTNYSKKLPTDPAKEMEMKLDAKAELVHMFLPIYSVKLCRFALDVNSDHHELALNWLLENGANYPEEIEVN